MLDDFVVEVIAEISLDALSHNLHTIRAKAPKSQVMAMIKADAYGHGLLTVAAHFEALAHKPDAFGVARLSEAVLLRKNNINTPIVLLEGVSSGQELVLAESLNLQLVIHQLWQLELLLDHCKSSGSYPVSVWLKLDTGMHRLGLTSQELLQATQGLKAQCFKGKVSLMTHFACSDETDNPYTQKQLAYFNQYASEFSESSTANSAAIFAWPESHKEWNRPGISLYGVSPFATLSAHELGLLPVMTLKSKVIAVRPLKAGEPVGYGSTWSRTKDTMLAVIAMGYGDGYPRHAPSGTPVLIKGKCFPLAGRVSMDMLVVDLGRDAGVAVGDEVVLWGEGLAVEKIAEAAGTIGYELLCGLTKRVEFKYG